MIPGKMEVCGLTPRHQVPDYCPRHFSQLCTTDTVALAMSDPAIEDIVRVGVGITVRGFKVICTAGCRKVVVHAVREVEVTTRSKGARFVTTACQPFCAVIPIDGGGEGVREVRIVVEDISVCPLGNRCVAVSSVLLLVPLLKKREREDSSIRCDIRLSENPTSYEEKRPT